MKMERGKKKDLKEKEKSPGKEKRLPVPHRKKVRGSYDGKKIVYVPVVWFSSVSRRREPERFVHTPARGLSSMGKSGGHPKGRGLEHAESGTCYATRGRQEAKPEDLEKSAKKKGFI